MIAKMAPNPQYSFLPIVILKSLRSLPIPTDPRASALRALLLSVKRKLDYFGCFFCSRFEVPLLQSVERRIDEQRTSPNDSRVRHVAVGCDGGLNFDLPGDVHLFSKRRIFRGDL